jgi:psiF repeat
MKQLLTFALLSLFACGAYAAEATMTPQQEKMKTCNTKAGDMKGDERKAFMKTCLSAKPEPAKSKMAMCNEKTKGMSKPDADKARSECMKAS